MSSRRTTGQEALLKWTQAHTFGYKGVNVVDLTYSWQNGLALCALVHAFHPDKIPFDDLKPENKEHNLKIGFDTAATVGIPALLDPEDMLLDCGPDKRSVATYLSQFFHKFKDFHKQNSEGTTDQDDEVRKRREMLDKANTKVERKCNKCGETLVSGAIIQALEKHFHSKCFVCHSCNKPFQNNKFMNVDGSPYCAMCARKSFSTNKGGSAAPPPPVSDTNPPCFKCKELCAGEVINAIGQTWHPNCFVCDSCSRPFKSGKFLNVDNKPFCEQCGKMAFISTRRKPSPAAAAPPAADQQPPKPADPPAKPATTTTAEQQPTTKPATTAAEQPTKPAAATSSSATSVAEPPPPAKSTPSAEQAAKPPAAAAASAELAAKPAEPAAEAKLGSNSSIFNRAKSFTVATTANQVTNKEPLKPAVVSGSSISNRLAAFRGGAGVSPSVSPSPQNTTTAPGPISVDKAPESGGSYLAPVRPFASASAILSPTPSPSGVDKSAADLAEERRQKRAAEEAKKKKEMEEREAKRKEMEELERVKKEEQRKAREEERKKKKEEEDRKKAEEEEKKKKEQEEKDAKKIQERNQRTEAAQKKREEMKRIVEQEEAKKNEAKEAERQKRLAAAAVRSPDITTTLTFDAKPTPTATGAGSGTTAARTIVITAGTTNLTIQKSPRGMSCSAADVNCPWTGADEKSVQQHVATCHYVALQPVLSLLLQQNKELTSSLKELQQQYEDLKAKTSR